MMGVVAMPVMTNDDDVNGDGGNQRVDHPLCSGGSDNKSFMGTFMSPKKDKTFMGTFMGHSSSPSQFSVLLFLKSHPYSLHRSCRHFFRGSHEKGGEEEEEGHLRDS